MTFPKLAVFSGVFFLLPLLALGRGHPNGGDTGGRQITLGDCTFQVPPNAKYTPTENWYETFKKTYEPARAEWESAVDRQNWQAKEVQQFNSCAAFKILMGICWKESGLNPSVGNGNDPIPSPGLCQIQARNCARYGISAGQLHNPVRNIECAGKIMGRILKEHKCITQGAEQAGNGKCFTNWSVMIRKAINPKVGKREEIQQYVTGGNGN